MSKNDYKEKVGRTAINHDSPRGEIQFKKMDETDEFGRHKLLPTRSNLKFDEQEELISAFKEQMRLEKELDEAKFRLANQQDFNLMDAF